MWANGFTPKAWKISNTILIDKNKGDETEVSSFRPIGLAKTLLKLWTRLITNTRYEYAETQHHNSWLLQTQRYHPPTPKRNYGSRRCQTLQQRHLCPDC